MRLLLCSFSVFLLAGVIQAQYVYGDRSTKKYFSIECGEVEKMDLSNRQGFKSSADAEKAGFTKGEQCSSSTDKPIFVAPALSKRGPTVTVGELRKDSVTIEMIETDFAKYGKTPQKFVGSISVSSYYVGWYERNQRDLWAFRLCDGTGCGFFYISKDYRSDKIREILMSPTRNSDLIWICQYQAQGKDIIGTLLGELISCTPLTLLD